MDRRDYKSEFNSLTDKEDFEDLSLKISDSYLNGSTLNWISKDYNLPTQVIRMILNYRNIKLRSKAETNKIISNNKKSKAQLLINSMTNDELSKFENLITETYNKGFSTSYVNKKFGINTKTLNNILLKHNVEIRDPSKSHNLETAKELCKKTWIKKYGTDHPLKSKEVQDNRRKSCLEKYGVDHYSKTDNFKNKFSQTCLKRYGFKTNLQCEETKMKIRKTNIKRYNVIYPCISKNCIMSSGKQISKINKKFAELLEDNNINSEFEFHFSKVSYDLHILNSNILIEINPTYTHNSTIGVCFNKHRKDPISSNYHLDKSKLAEENGYQCIHVFDWDNWNDILNLIKSLINNSFNFESSKYVEIANNKLIVNRSKINLIDTNNYRLLKEIVPENHKIMLRKQEVEIYDCGKLILERKEIK